MADLNYNGLGPGMAGERHPQGDSRTSRFINILGGVISIGLIVGLGAWSYKLLVRDVTGVPVVRAMEGPMRVAPEDPGGERAAHQGLAVNRIAAVGDAAPPPERIVLAPRSVDLAAEDLTQAALQLAPELTAAPRPRASAVEAAELSATTAVMMADLGDAPLAEVIPASVPGVSRSLRPRPRPEGDANVAVAISSETPPLATEIDAESLLPGTWLVQFAAPNTVDEARSYWAGLEGRFSSLMAGKSRVIEKATTGGDTFYRLRAEGFVDLADARRFCAAFVAEDADCIPVVVR